MFSFIFFYLTVNNTVVQFGQLGLVPSIGGPDQITCDALQAIYVGAATVWTFIHYLLGILITTVHATVAGMVDGTVTDVQPVHHVNDIHHCLGVVGGIAVYLHIEDMSARGECMIWSLYLCLMQCGTLIVDRNMVGVGVIIQIGRAHV